MKFELKENFTGKSIPEFLTKVDIDYTDNEISFEFDCKNSQYFSAYNGYNEDLWKGDVCEAFISCSENRSIYYEIEVAPNNALFLKLIENKGNGVLIENEVREEDSFLSHSVTILGNGNYKVRFVVDLKKAGYDGKTKILFNAFRIETEGGIPDKNLMALNPTLCDTFHKPAFFVELKK